MWKYIARRNRSIKVLNKLRTLVAKHTIDKWRPKYISGYAREGGCSLLGNLSIFRIQKFGVDIQHLHHDLEKNVIVNTDSQHKELQVSTLPNIPDIPGAECIYRDDPVYTPVNMMKYSNKIQLTTGYPNYYCMELNIRELLGNHTKSFPLDFKVFTNHLV